MQTSAMTRFARLALPAAAVLVLGGASCPGLVAPGRSNFNASTHYQTWKITLAGQVTATVRATIGSTGNGTFESVTPWVLHPDGDQCTANMTVVTGNIGYGSMSFTTTGSGCGWNIQGTASGNLNGNTADLANFANGSMRISYQSLTRLPSTSGSGNWVAAKQ